MARKMSPTERAVRDVLNKYVRDGHISRAEANDTIRGGLYVAEGAVRAQYRDGGGSALYYGGKVAEAREDYEAARGELPRRMMRGRLLAAEMFAAVFAAVQAEEGPREGEELLTPEQAEAVMATARGAAREVPEEAAASAGGHTAPAPALSAA
ncbi:hypothetical protein ACWGMW_29840 [Streptomyces albidoflavus]